MDEYLWFFIELSIMIAVVIALHFITIYKTGDKDKAELVTLLAFVSGIMVITVQYVVYLLR